MIKNLKWLKQDRNLFLSPLVSGMAPLLETSLVALLFPKMLPIIYLVHMAHYHRLLSN